MFKKSRFIDITPKHVYDIDISTPYVHFLVFFKHIISRCVFLTDEKLQLSNFNNKKPQRVSYS